MNVDEPLDGLQEDTNTQSQQEDTIEEGTDETSSLPTKGKILARCSLFGNLWRISKKSGVVEWETYNLGRQSNNKADQIVQLPGEQLLVTRTN